MMSSLPKIDRKSTRLNSSHGSISYAVFCLKKQFILDGNNPIRALLPLLSLGQDTASLNPKLSTSPIARKINLVDQTKLIIRRDLQRYQIMHIRIHRRIKYCS